MDCISHVDCARLVDTEHGQCPAQAKEHRNAEREVEEFRIVEELPHLLDERVVDRAVIGDESRGIFDRQAPPGMRLLDIQACFQVAHGSAKRREAMLWQKIDPSSDYAALVHPLTTERPAEHRAPGSYMSEALK
ncbi:MAG: hypothetical protein ACRDTV_20825 [Mycobacterium sp.]